MISRIAGVMNARRNSLQEKEKGFTLIELLVVIVIIGILAAIAIPVYLNVQNNAKDSAVQSDLTNAKTAVISHQTTSGSLPPTNADISAGVNGITAAEGYTKSVDVNGTINYKLAANNTSFCISAASITGSLYYVTDTLGVTKAADAAAITAAGC